MTITTPIFYTNGMPHIGHLYSGIYADYLKRCYQLHGLEVFLSTGTDEHGAKMLKTALAAGYRDPGSLCDLHAAAFHAMMTKASVSFDRFIRTSDRTLRFAIL